MQIFGSLTSERPELAQLAARKDPGFLGLNLPRRKAEALLAQLKEYGAHGFVVPAGLRSPPIGKDEAHVIATQLVRKKRLRLYPGERLGNVVFRGDRSYYWEFFAPLPDLQKGGLIPGGIFALVDKMDGHDWTLEEQEHRLASA